MSNGNFTSTVNHQSSKKDTGVTKLVALILIKGSEKRAKGGFAVVFLALLVVLLHELSPPLERCGWRILGLVTRDSAISSGNWA